LSVGSSLVAVDTAGGTPNIVLTYDDGPEPGGTDTVLRALAEADVTATFFVLLSRTRRYPSLLAEAVAAGHEIALHGLNHRRLTRLPASAVAARTIEAKHELEDMIGQPVQWLRPPYGSQTPATWRAVTDAGLTPVMWNVECREWLNLPEEVRLAQVRSAEAGSVVLAHDGFASRLDGVDDGPPPPLDRGDFARSLIGICKSKGFVCSSLAHALRTGQPVLRVWLDEVSPYRARANWRDQP
jgi:peptidoglycan/xylan/chitin deacetylase (PgdA/CDA1 family)